MSDSSTLTEAQIQWNEMADTYVNLIQTHNEPVALQLINQMNLETAKNILEVGAGGGHTSKDIVARLAQLNSPAHFTASDFAPKMVDYLQKAMAPYPKVRCVAADAGKLPFGDGEFDRYIAGFTLPVVPDWRAVISESARVLAPGGIAAFSTWGAEDDCVFMKIDRLAAERAGLPARGPSNAYSVANALDEAVALFKSVGFKSVAKWTTSFPMCTVSKELFRRIFFVGPMAKPKEHAKAYEAAVEALLDEKLNANEAVVFNALCFVAQK